MCQRGRVKVLTLFALRCSSLNSGGVEDQGLLITNVRHYDLLCRTKRNSSWPGGFARSAQRKVVLVPLHNALRYLGQITGETTTEDILSEIFATFCIGK